MDDKCTCGAAIAMPLDAQEYTCPFCGRHYVLDSEIDNGADDD
jgi:predicted RNA-binding Zn-ribbon protein involved in translation (DUF1610 family)